MQTSGASRGEAADARLESTNALRSLWSEVTTHYRLRHSGMRRQAQASDAQLRIGESRDSGFDAEPVIGPRFARTRWHRPGMTVMDCTRSLSSSRIHPTRWLAMTMKRPRHTHGAAQENVAATLPSPKSSITTLSPAVSQIVLTRLPVSTISPAERPLPSEAR
jgi:hypothetical protein